MSFVLVSRRLSRPRAPPVPTIIIRRPIPVRRELLLGRVPHASVDSQPKVDPPKIVVTGTADIVSVTDPGQGIRRRLRTTSTGYVRVSSNWPCSIAIL